MYLILSITLLTNTPDLGPRDILCYNLRTVRADVLYTYTSTLERGIEGKTGSLRLLRGTTFSDSGKEIVGRWATDGTTELFTYKPASGSSPSAAKTSDGTAISIASYELISDGTTNACRFSLSSPRVWATVSVRAPMPTLGPFGWWGLYPFPRILSIEYSNAAVQRMRALREGHPAEVEVYRNEYSTGYDQVEVYYDASVGYAPRYVRGVLVDSVGSGTFKECYVADFTKVGEDVYIPAHWYETAFTIPGFRGTYPTYSFETPVRYPSSVYVGRFMATKTVPLSEIIAFKPDKVQVLESMGGNVPVPRGIGPLTLDRVKSLLGRRLTEPVLPPLPSLDRAELGEFAVVDEPASKNRLYVALSVAFAVVAVLVVIRVRRARWTASLALIAVALVGCGGGSHQDNPTIIVSPQKRVTIVDDFSPVLVVPLLIHNHNPYSLKIVSLDGGCVCRKVTASFPICLKGHTEAKVHMEIENRHTYEPITFRLTCETDHGRTAAPVSLLALAGDQLSPNYLWSTTLTESETWSPVLTHRRIYSKEQPGSQTVVELPEEFIARIREVKRGAIKADPNLLYEDTVYELSLKERSLGMHKGIASVFNNQRQRISEATLVWQRTPFLSSMPEKVLLLNSRPTRVFLRCTDDEVELTQILSKPIGVEAVIASPREIIVKQAAEAPRQISGYIEVSTTAKDNARLRISVMRPARVSEQGKQAKPES